MSTSTTVVERLLQAHGFELRRSKRHKVYRREDGKTFVRASTPSDFRAEHNSLGDLCRVLGIRKSEAMEFLRRRRTVAEEKHPEPWLLPAVVESPQPSAVPAMSREDRSLAKRIARIERNQKAKQEKFDAKWKRFMSEDAILYVATNHFEFVDVDDTSTIQRLDDLVDDLVDGEETIAAKVMGGGEIRTVPDLVLHFRMTGDRLLYVFEDGSGVAGRLQSLPKRISSSTHVVFNGEV